MAQTVSFTKRVPPGAAGAGTLQALMAKQKEAAAARDAAASATPTIQSPWQGAAMIGNTISAGVREGRAANQEAQARQQLADLMAKVGHGGSTPEMEAQIAVLDPELAKQYRQEAIDARTRADEAKAVIDAREDTQAFQGGENAATRAVTTSEGAANRAVTTRSQDIGHEEFEVSAAETKRANLAGENGAAAQREETRRSNLAGENGAEAQRAETQRSNIASETNQAATLAETSIHNRAGEANAAGQLEIEQEKLPGEIRKTAVGTQFGPIKTGAELGITDPELVNAPFQMDEVTKEWTPVVSGGGTNITTNVGGGKKLDETLDTEEGKIWTGHQKERNVAAGSQKDMQMLSELVKMAPQGPIMGALASIPVLKGFSNAGVAFSSIVKRVAPTLRVEGSGSTSDIEYQGMLDSLPSLANYPEANALIIGMMQAKSAINIERGNIVDQYRNGEISDIDARRKLAAVNQRSISNPELEALFAKVGGGVSAAPGGGNPEDDDLLNRY